MLKQRPDVSNLPKRGGPSLQMNELKDKVNVSWQRAKVDRKQLVTIKLLGSAKDSIDDIVSGLPCSQICKQQITQVLSIYGEKINKLRKERDFYKRSGVIEEKQSQKQIVDLKRRVQELQDLVDHQSRVNCSCEQCSCQQCSCQGEGHLQLYQFQPESCKEVNHDYTSSKIVKQSQVRSQQVIIVNNSLLTCKAPDPVQQSLLVEHNQSFAHSQTNNITHGTLQSQVSDFGSDGLAEADLFKIMLKYNFDLQELQHILEEYQTDHKMAADMFESQQNRKLYRLGLEMNKNVWNKKIMHDIKRLSSLKQQNPHSASSPHPSND